MNTNKITKVYSVSGFLHAVAMQTSLEKAGVGVTVLRSEKGYDLMVSAAQAAEARELLHPQTRSGEIYFIPSQPVHLTRPRF